MTEKVYKDAKGVLYRVGETGELGNADRCRLTIQQLGITPGAQWRKKSMAPNWSMAARKDALQALDILAEENDWQQATEAEIQYNLTERVALLDDDPDSTSLYSLDLSERTIRCLERAGIDTVEELAAMSDEEIMRIRDMGRKGYEEIRAALGRAETGDAVNPTPMDDLPWSAAATAVESQPAESPAPAALTPTTGTAAAVSEQADNAAAPVPASSNTLTAFDYSGLDEQTTTALQALEYQARGEYARHCVVLAGIVAEANKLLCQSSERSDDSKHANRGEDTFTVWCHHIGVSKSTAYQLLNVQKLIDSSQPEEQAVLEQQPISLLYAAAKPSAPEELVQGVKNGDITTHKQYKALEKQLAQERELRRQAEVGRDAAVKDVRQLEKEQAEDRQWMDSEVEKANQKADLAARKSAEAWEQVNAERKARKQAEEKLASAGAEQEKMERLADDEIARVQRIADDANDRANAAEAKVKELESRPIEVTGADAADIARWRAEGAEQARQEQAGIIAEMQGQVEDAKNAQGNVVDALYIMVQQIAANCAAQLDNWSKAAACLEPDAYMDCVQQLDALRIQILQMMMEGTDDDEVS